MNEITQTQFVQRSDTAFDILHPAVEVFAGRRGADSVCCRCDCGTIKVIPRQCLAVAFKGSCDRCAKSAKTAYLKVARWRSQGVPQVEMARRLGTKEQWVSRKLDPIED